VRDAARLIPVDANVVPTHACPGVGVQALDSMVISIRSDGIAPKTLAKYHTENG
jgi:hypothetical protein